MAYPNRAAASGSFVPGDLFNVCPQTLSHPTLKTFCFLFRSKGFVWDDRNISATDKARLERITKAGDDYLRSLLVMGARAILTGLGDKQDGFSRLGA